MDTDTIINTFRESIDKIVNQAELISVQASIHAGLGSILEGVEHQVRMGYFALHTAQMDIIHAVVDDQLDRLPEAKDAYIKANKNLKELHALEKYVIEQMIKFED